MNKYKKLFIVMMLLISLPIISVKVFAQVLDYKKEDLGLPPIDVVQQENLGKPESIYVVPIFIDSDEIVPDIEWYKGLYYYQGVRLNQGDFLFHYFVTKSGDILEGNSLGEEQRLAIKDDVDNPIIIGYFAGIDNDFADSAKRPIGELIIDIANKNLIPLDRVFVKGIHYEVTESKELIAVVNDLASSWRNSMKEITTTIENKYDPQSFKFDLEIVAVKMPEEAVNFGDSVLINISVKNNSAISLYQGTDFEPLMAKVEGDSSKFFINDIWSSPTQTLILPDDTVIRPDETKEVQVRIGVPLEFGTITEQFQLQTIFGEIYPDTKFDISIIVNKPSQEVIEIQDTSVGYLNVRKEPSAGSEQVSRVSPGQRFLVVERSGGWVKIDLNDGKSGWVTSSLTKVIEV